MKATNIVNATEQEQQQILESILISISSDPFVRWFWPNASDYVNCYPVFDAFGVGEIDHQSAYRTTGFEGMAFFWNWAR